MKSHLGSFGLILILFTSQTALAAGELVKAVKDRDIGEVRRLIATGRDVNESDDFGWTPLYAAANSIDIVTIPIAQVLIEAGADVNHGDINHNKTPLHVAALNGHTFMVQALIAAGASVNYADKYGQTPLFSSIVNNKIVTTQTLYGAGADVNQIDRDGENPLHEAARSGRTEIVLDLIERGVNINLANTTGRTPLHYAAWNGHTAIVQALILAGADMNQADKEGNSPLDYAPPGSRTQLELWVQEEIAQRISEALPIMPTTIAALIADKVTGADTVKEASLGALSDEITAPSASLTGSSPSSSFSSFSTTQ